MKQSYEHNKKLLTICPAIYNQMNEDINFKQVTA